MTVLLLKLHLSQCYSITTNLTLPGYHSQHELTLEPKPGVPRLQFDCACKNYRV